MFDRHNLKIVAFNVNGNLNLKKPDIEHFLLERDIDIFLLGETSFKKNNFTMPGYKT